VTGNEVGIVRCKLECCDELPIWEAVSDHSRAGSGQVRAISDHLARSATS
jgi:hypothetical protein